MGFSWSQNFYIIFKYLKLHNMILHNEKKERESSPGESFLYGAQECQGGGRRRDIKVQVFWKKKLSVLTDTAFSPLLFEDLRRNGSEWDRMEEMLRKVDMPRRLEGAIQSP